MLEVRVVMEQTQTVVQVVMERGLEFHPQMQLQELHQAVVVVEEETQAQAHND
jgi:hypothetical protein